MYRALALRRDAGLVLAPPGPPLDPRGPLVPLCRLRPELQEAFKAGEVANGRAQQLGEDRGLMQERQDAHRGRGGLGLPYGSQALVPRV